MRPVPAWSVQAATSLLRSPCKRLQARILDVGKISPVLVSITTTYRNDACSFYKEFLHPYQMYVLIYVVIRQINENYMTLFKVLDMNTLHYV